jgi:DNA-binding transcriptional regulator YiaG
MNQRQSTWMVGQDVTDACNKMIEEVFSGLHQGSAMRGLRLREGLTQEQLARLLGVKRRISRRWKTASAPSAKTWPNAWLRS